MALFFKNKSADIYGLYEPSMVQKGSQRFPAYSKTVVIMLKDMVLKLESEWKTFETFLGPYWVHRYQYTPKKEKQRK